MSFNEEEEEEDSEYRYLLNTWDPLLSSTAERLLDEGILDDWHLTPPFQSPFFHPPAPSSHFTWPRDTSEEEEEYLEELNHDVAMTETDQEVQTTKDTTIMEQFEMEPKTVEPTEPEIPEVKIQVCSRVQRMMQLFEEQKRQVEQLKIKREIVDSDDEAPMEAKEEGTALGSPLDPVKPPAKKRKAARRHSIESSSARRSRLKRNRSKLAGESAEHREARLAKQRVRDAERRLRRLEAKATAEAESASEASADKVKSPPGAPKQPSAGPKNPSGQCQVVSRRRSTSDLSLYSPHPMALRARRPIKY